MSYPLQMSDELHDWLADLRETNPPAALPVGQALVALMSEGTDLGPPLVVPVTAAWPEDLVTALDDSYQRRLERLQLIRRRAADASSLVEDLNRQIDEPESAQARLTDQHRRALREGRPDDAERAARQLAAAQRDAAMARQLVPGTRENQLRGRSRRPPGDRRGLRPRPYRHTLTPQHDLINSCYYCVRIDPENTEPAMANTGAPATCAACGRPLPEQQGRGRTRRYCDATCRSKARRTRQTSQAGVNQKLTNPTREGKFDNVPDSQSGAAPGPAAAQAAAGKPAPPPLLTSVLSAARVALADVPPDDQLSPLQAVGTIRSLARVVEDGLREAVQQARQAGHTWAELGDLLGTTRQAAFQRFGRPIDPRTGVPMAEETIPAAAGRASALLADIAERRWSNARAAFSPRMANALDAPGLAAAWAQVLGTAGAYQGMGEPVVHQAGDYTVADVPLHFEAAELTGRVSFDQSGQVAGLYFV